MSESPPLCECKRVRMKSQSCRLHITTYDIFNSLTTESVVIISAILDTHIPYIQHPQLSVQLEQKLSQGTNVKAELKSQLNLKAFVPINPPSLLHLLRISFSFHSDELKLGSDLYLNLFIFVLHC